MESPPGGNPFTSGSKYEQSGDQAQLDPWAEYAILTVDGMAASLGFRRIPLDMKKMADIYRHSGRPFTDTAMDQYVRVSA